MSRSSFIAGLSLGLLVVACASRSYPVYVLRYREGRLNAHESKNDLPISVCDDTAQSRANCYVMLRSDYIKLSSDLIEIKNQLASCQKEK